MIESALKCIERGWHVFPCWPKTKQPMTRHGFRDATNDRAQIEAWWTKTPEANIAIACGPSNLAVVDIDHGLSGAADLDHFIKALGGDVTYTVRTGRRPEFGVQLYFEGTIPDVGLWKFEGCEGQVKSQGGYVMAAGSRHPSGELYEALYGVPVVPIVGTVRGFRTERSSASPDDNEPITSNRNVRLTSIGGRMRNAGMPDDELEDYLLRQNAKRCVPPMDEDEVKRIVANICRYAPGEDDPVVILGKPKAAEPEPVKPKLPDDWKTWFHSYEQIKDAPPVTFLIDGFLTDDAITAIAAPVAQRKSLIALNVVHALLTGEKLFDYFEVKRKPPTVFYLCPEMGIQSFSARLKDIGLLEYVGKTLFCRTMASEFRLGLEDLTPEMLAGSVVVLDTAIRFLKGNEDKSEDMQLFSKEVFRLITDGAKSVVMLHHSLKGTKESSDLTLENIMRGSGELGASIASCWATRLQDPSDPYNSPSFLVNVKQRDFESDPFEAVSDASCRMRRVANDGKVSLRTGTAGNQSDKDGKDGAALAFIRENMDLTIRETVKALAAEGIKRSTGWVSERKTDIKGSGVKRTHD